MHGQRHRPALRGASTLSVDPSPNWADPPGMIVLIPILAAIAGALIYAFASGKVSEIGRITFGAGILVALLALAGSSIRLIPA